MRILHAFGGFLKGKVLIALCVSLLVIGGTSAVMASTPGGQSIFTHPSPATKKATVKISVTTSVHVNTPVKVTVTVNGTTVTTDINKACANLGQVQQMINNHHLKTMTATDALALARAICALHNGTFSGVTPAGATVTSSRHFTFAETDQLLTLAVVSAIRNIQHGSHGTMVNLHLVAFLAVAVQNCGSASSVAGCVRGKIMAFPPITPPAAPTIPAIPTP